MHIDGYRKTPKGNVMGALVVKHNMLDSLSVVVETWDS